MKIVSTLLALFLSLLCTAQSSGPKSVLIRYAEAHLGNGEVIKNAWVGFEKGEITMLADGSIARINIEQFDSVVDADGLHLYPGFIVMDSRLGLWEIGSVRATHDFQEREPIAPSVRAAVAFNAESKVIGTTLPSGVLMAQVAPKGGRLSGRSSLMRLGTQNWKDALVSEDEGTLLNWPLTALKKGWWLDGISFVSNEKRKKEVDELYAFFEEARAYAIDSLNSKINPRFESMKALFSGKARLYIRASRAQEMLEAVQFKRHFAIPNVTFIGAEEAVWVLNEIKENNISVVLNRVHALPMNDDTPIHEPYELAANLHTAGIAIAFSTNGDMEAVMSRNLPYQVGTAIAYGLPEEAAIEALTKTPATLCGASKAGEIKIGNEATFFLCKGSPFDPTKGQVVTAVVQGTIVDLSNHQSDLYHKFKE